jgi:hypothetical protein
MAAGRFPVKAASYVLKLIEAVEANGQYKGLNTANLVITHICCHRSARAWHYGRHRGRKMKRTSVELVVQEKAQPEKKGKKAGEAPKAEVKAEKPSKKADKKDNTHNKDNKAAEESKGGN